MLPKNIALASIAACIALSCSTTPPPAARYVEPVPIRAFDVPTIERLAREMYEQDQLAARATDVVLAHIGRDAADEGGIHWITGTRDEREVVRFVRIDGRPEALYDVTFSAAGEPAVSVPVDRTLTPAEIAQFDARMLALKELPQQCSDRFNTVALRDPESDGWLVWALAATLDPDQVVIGGHYRFTISADGEVVHRRDALSTTCLRFERDEKSAGSFMSHVVSLTPVETHAFASLLYAKVLHVGTTDGRAWRVDAGRITQVEADAPGLDGFSARALAGIYERCAFIVSIPNRSPRKYSYTGNIKVIEVTESEPTYSVEDPAEGEIEWVTCARQDIVPMPNDYKVAAAGYSLSITDTGTGHPKRSGLLSLANGKFSFEIREGEPLTPELARRIDERLEAFQWALMRSPR